jgi:hypothetical protein
MLCLPYYCLCLLFNKIREEGGTGSAWKWEVGRVGGGRGAQTMYAHVSECKNDKKKAAAALDLVLEPGCLNIKKKTQNTVILLGTCGSHL